MSDSIINPDKALARLAIIEAEKRRVTNEIDAARARINAEAEKSLTPLLEEEKGIRASLQAHFTANRKSIFHDGAKSVRFMGGVIGFRLSPSKLTIAKLATFAERIRGKMGKKADQYLTVKVSPDKTMLGKLPDDLLKELGVKRTQKEEFFIDVDGTKIDEAYADAVGAGK